MLLCLSDTKILDANFRYLCFIFLVLLLIYIRVQPINNVVRISDGQQRDSTMHKHVAILPQTPLLSRPELFFNKVAGDWRIICSVTKAQAGILLEEPQKL